MDFIQLYEKLFGKIDQYVINNLTTEEVFDLDSCPNWSDEVGLGLLKELTEKYKILGGFKVEKWKEKAIKDLNTIISNQSKKSYLQANRKQDGSYYRKHRPYSITEESKKALEFINILNNNTVTLDQEEEIKAFLMPFRTFRNFI